MTRVARAADRSRIAAMLPPEARATFNALPAQALRGLMLLEHDDSTVRGACSFQEREDSLHLQTVLLPISDPDGFRLLLLGLARHGLALGKERGSSWTEDVAIKNFLVRRYGLTAIPSGRDPVSGRALSWRFDVDLAEFAATLEQA